MPAKMKCCQKKARKYEKLKRRSFLYSVYKVYAGQEAFFGSPL